ncbi:MAG: 3',5'-cyclic adenosine monophosphate phosphodiesterase CpdA [Gemmatimonadaceae bacterium]|nr:3',5'-cyclic adenosine monophosphate phosphodiesterase CpdA [Gemmatimonadaceae bacterium]
MRLIHLSDLHLGFRQFQRTTPTGINQREADIAHVFRRTIDAIVERAPELVIVAGDVFHNVRPSNPAILTAFQQFSRLRQELPETIVVMLAGNHDTPRAAETGCILRLFSPLGIEVVDSRERRIAFADRSLSILAVPDVAGQRPQFEIDPAFRFNVLAFHGELPEFVPKPWADSERASLSVSVRDLNIDKWSYVALGHHHVFKQVAPHAYYSGAMEYASLNIWGELAEETAAKLRGKYMIEYDLESGKRTMHKLPLARPLVDLPVIRARSATAAEIDAAIRANVEGCRQPGGIDDKIVRQLVYDVPRHVARELDHRAIRAYRKRALQFHLDTRRPDVARPSASGVASRRASLSDIVRDRLWSRPLAPDVNREALVELGLQYLQHADVAESDALAVPESE